MISQSRDSLEDVVNLSVFLTDLNCFDLGNEAMAVYLRTPSPARPVVGIASPLRAAPIESDAIVCLGD
jgi:enamine deaminase RidA (YjgF/YER057c/UK114 family)